jgi:NAD(P)-dependent dehydrogenase (short-subunit alcohol dehydrogenase family)
VNSIAPGAIRTPILCGRDKPEHYNELLKLIHLHKRIGEPEEIGRRGRLASDESDYIQVQRSSSMAA